jgi:hypothetical protein
MNRLLLAGLACLVTLGACEPIRAGDQVPFKGVFYPTIVGPGFMPCEPLPGDCPEIGCPQAVGIVVPGKATHLGKFDGVAAACLSEPDENGVIRYTCCFIWNSPNGKDSIRGTFCGQFVPTEQAGVYQNVETFTIGGVTGRFEGAEGGGTAGGVVDLVTGNNVAPFTGTVSRPYSTSP